ncbi:MAG: efflux RND transporter permease subunit, partial [Alphaproteobacteria bacterium]|nr:efflux RND transporter permease subunit [Alphaproteobacteria bacterium]
SGRLYINVGSPDRRSASVGAIMDRLYAATADVPGIRLHLQPAQDVQLETRISRTQYQYVLQDLDEAELRQWTVKLVTALQGRPELRDATTDLEDQAPQIELTVDREAAARFGVTAAAIDNVLYDAFGQRQIATIFSQFDQYHVVMEVEPRLQNDPSVLNQIFVTSASAQAGTIDSSASGVGAGFQQASSPIPLSAFARIEQTSEPLTLTHQGLFPATTISFNLPPGGSLGQAVAALHRAEAAVGLPDTITTTMVGSAGEFESSQRSELALLAAAIVAVYIVLGVLYESYIHPITILSTLPSAGIGALLALILFGQDLNLISLIGIILLIGIVKKNAIMMVDFALDAERSQGLPAAQAIRQASLLRFRPIMMTTMAALLGALPLAIGGGTGSELRRPLGIAVVGGLVLSQFLTLYTTPVIYLFFDRLRHRVRPRAAAASRAESP